MNRKGIEQFIGQEEGVAWFFQQRIQAIRPGHPRGEQGREPRGLGGAVGLVPLDDEETRALGEGAADCLESPRHILHELAVVRALLDDREVARLSA